MVREAVRLSTYLREQGLTNKQARQALESGRVYLDDTPTADAGREIDEHQVTLRWSAPRLTAGRDPVIVYHDETLAVVAKPSGLLAVPAVRRHDPSALSFVRRVLGGPALAVHRLDEGTSGLMLVARTPPMQLALKEELAQRAIQRRYMAIVRHCFSDAEQTFDTILVRDRGDGKRGSSASAEAETEGKRAVTHVRRLEALARDASLIEARLETGRTHQIRIHMSEAGFPILGDSLYGGGQGIVRSSPRLALHAWHLAFYHPDSGVECAFAAPLPDDLEKLRRTLNQPRPSFGKGRGRICR